MKLFKDYLTEETNTSKAPGKGSTTKDVGGYLDHPNRGHHDGSDGVSHYYVMYKPKQTINSLKKAGWEHKPGALDKGGIQKSDEYKHPDGHTIIKHKVGSSEFRVNYKGQKRAKRPIDYSLPGHYD